jgi:cytochrome P450
MVHELMGWEWDTVFAPYGDQWRAQRKFLHQTFHPTAVKKFRPHSLKAAHGLLRRFLKKPGDVIGNLRHMAGQTVISIAYGLDVQEENDPYIHTAEEANRSVTEAGVPGAFLVDSFPILKYVPEWVPGAGFKKKAKEWKELATAMLDAPFKAAMSRIETGNYVPSFVAYCHSDIIEKKEDFAQQEFIIKSTAAAMYSAGSDTTVSVIATCIIALLKHPEILKRAQDEIDSALALGELPTFNDEDRLPYVTAVSMESYRWRVAVPIAIPHFLIQDDVYKGYMLPKGSVVVPNSWAMLHDEAVYPDPFSFKPERFLKNGQINKEVRDPIHMAFGYGRRICPGRHFAVSAVWIAIASLVAAFDITKAIDEDGNVVEADPPYQSSLLCIAKQFTCSMKPRSKKHEQAIHATLGREYEYEW